jgi:hypothetical protein
MDSVSGDDMSHRLPYLQWLKQLKVGDTVVAYIGSEAKGEHVITSASEHYVTIGKYGRALRFNLKTGKLCGDVRLKHLFRIEPE